MAEKKSILMIDAGNMFGVRNRDGKDPFYREHIEFIDQYELPYANLDDYACISINAFADQVLLERNKEKCSHIKKL